MTIGISSCGIFHILPAPDLMGLQSDSQNTTPKEAWQNNMPPLFSLAGLLSATYSKLIVFYLHTIKRNHESHLKCHVK